VTDRKTASTITDTDLDELYGELEQHRTAARQCNAQQWPQRLATAQAQIRADSIAMERLGKELAALRQVARGYCPHCGRGDATPTVEDWEQQKQRADDAEAAIEAVRAYAADLERAGWTGPAIARRIRQALDGTSGPAATEATDAPSWLHAGTCDLSIPDHQVDEESGPA
jgi:hypothetical protein